MSRCNRTDVIMGLVVAVWLAAVPHVVAQEAPGNFGTQDSISLFISAEEFQSPAQEGYYYTGNGFWSGEAPPMIPLWPRAPLRLPAGALLEGYTVIYDDSSAVSDLFVGLGRYWVKSDGTVGASAIGSGFQSSGSPGITTAWVDIDPDITITYRYLVLTTVVRQSYIFWLEIPATLDLRFRGVVVSWKRQVSPVPLGATFDDVPTGHWAFRFIEALADAGITAGCSEDPPLYCPDDPITRAEMAVYLAAALGLHWTN